ncbi:MAG: translation factor Sua5 [Flavobacteriales bacterium]|nr:translation factor Sua5 [Flavobacteriales bacterium]|tara:strand:+ start:511 stop:1053 length:543 start_codon:yes stop_codon:yes gene_type:complete
MQNEIDKALEVLEKGGSILYPTDTIWGVGCDATNEDAITKIFKIKKRAENKSLISLVANKEQLKNLTGNIPNIDITSSPTTIIYPSAIGLNKNLLADNGSAAIRIVQDEFCQRLITKFGKAIVSSSANISGKPSPKNFSEISTEIKSSVDYIVNLRHNELMIMPSKILIINENGNITKIR